MPNVFLNRYTAGFGPTESDLKCFCPQEDPDVPADVHSCLIYVEHIYTNRLHIYSC